MAVSGLVDLPCAGQVQPEKLSKKCKKTTNAKTHVKRNRKKAKHQPRGAKTCKNLCSSLFFGGHDRASSGVVGAMVCRRRVPRAFRIWKNSEIQPKSLKIPNNKLEEFEMKELRSTLPDGPN